MSARPFPFASLPALSRAEIAAEARVRRAASALSPEQVAEAIAELCEEAASIAIRRVRPAELGKVASDAVGIALSSADDPSMHGAVLVEVEPALARALVARALRQRAPRISDAARALAPEVAGATAALVHAALRRAAAGSPLRVVAAGPAQALARDLAAAHGRVVTASLTVVLGPDTFDARLHVPEEALPRTDAPGTPSDALASLGEAPVALPLVISTCLASRLDVAALRPGDAFLFGSSGRKDAGREFAGPVALVAPRSERGLAAELAENGRLVLRTDRVESHPWDVPRTTNEEPAMSGEPSPTLQALEDAPIVVRVELGVVEMKAREWAALSTGDVVALGRKVGDPAVLRVGGVEVARGELVQVDGEYGVRILGRDGGNTK